MKIVTENQEKELLEIRNKLKEIQQLYQQLQTNPHCGDKLKKLLRNYTDERVGDIPRRLNQFDSDSITIVTMGMLKAGKSTLINLLARNRVASPTGYGVDTTLRPALIRMAGEKEEVGSGRIDIYSKVEDSEDRGFGQLMDYLRNVEDNLGLHHTSPLPKSPRTCDLTADNIRRALCCKPGSGDNLIMAEPLLVVITVPYKEDCHILKEKRMLLDMPGLDSANAEISSEQTKDCHFRYDTIISECDLMLFVQSSMAPLNDKATTMLNEILKQRSSASCYIVQNAMNARYWLQEKSLNKQQSEQGKHAVKAIDEMVQTINADGNHYSLTPNVCTVNLGMAYDGMFSNDNEIDKARSLTNGKDINLKNLQEYSKFLELESALLATVDANALHSRFDYCRNALRVKLGNFAKEIVSQIEVMEESYKRTHEEVQDWRSRLNEAEAILMKGSDYQCQGGIDITTKPDFEKCRQTAREMNPDVEKKRKVTLKCANGYFRDFKQACFEVACRFIEKEATIGNISIVDSDKEKKTNPRNAADVCNEQIRKTLEKLTELQKHIDGFERVPLKYEAPRNTLLSIPTKCNTSFRPINAEMDEEFVAIPDGGKEKEEKDEFKVSKAVRFFGLPCIPVGGERFANKMKQYETDYENTIKQYVQKHIDSALKRVIDDGVACGAKLFLKKLRENLEDAGRNCENIRLSIGLLQQILQKAKQMQNIERNLSLR